jgi:hypothetical protein
MSDQETAAVLVQCVGELGRGLAILDVEIRTRQAAAARETLRAMRMLVSVLDNALPAALDQQGGPYVTLCACGRVCEPDGATTCWRCG